MCGIAVSLTVVCQMKSRTVLRALFTKSRLIHKLSRSITRALMFNSSSDLREEASSALTVEALGGLLTE